MLALIGRYSCITGALLVSNLAHASCELLEYEKYLNSRSVVMMESALALAADDREAFKALRPFVKYQVRRNKLSSYIARELSSRGPALLDFSGNVGGLLPDYQLTLDTAPEPEDRLGRALRDDPHFIAEREALAPLESRYLFNEGMSDMERSRFWRARKLLGDYMARHQQFPTLETTHARRLPDLCS